MNRPDRILHAIGGTDPLGTYTTEDLDADDYIDPSTQKKIRAHDTFKLSRCKRGSVKLGHVKGGLEDCLDVNNHCEDLVIEASLWEPRGEYLTTIKGGSRNITVRGLVTGHGQTVDVDLGNLSDQSDDPTTDVKLDLTHVAGDPIRVRVLNAAPPILLNGGVQRYEIVFRLPGFWGELWAKCCAVWKKIVKLFSGK
jgi:hypothetical protein